MYWLDIIGAALSLICTYYFTTARRCAWVIGLAATTTNCALYWFKGIYGAALLDAIYFLTMVYGWYAWSKNKSTSTVLISHLTLAEGMFYSVVALIGILLMAKGLGSWTPSDIPYWDATVTVLSLLAQWLLCLKIIHCWFLWFIVDVLTALLQLYKGIPFHSAIHWMYLLMAMVGYYRWRKLYNSQTQLLQLQAAMP